MKNTAPCVHGIRLGLLACVWAVLPFAAPGIAQEVFKLDYLGSGMKEKMPGFRMKPLALTTGAPEGIKKSPQGLKSPLYGVLKIGRDERETSHYVILEVEDGKPAGLYVDTNGNGDLTDEPARNWKERPYKDREGKDAISYQSSAAVDIRFPFGTKSGNLIFYPQNLKSPRPSISYWCDYGLAGEVLIGGRSYPAALEDSGCMGEFSIGQDVMSTPVFWIGVTNETNRRGITTLASRPFQVEGKWWALTNLTAEGHFQIAAASAPVQPQQTGPDLSPGKKAPAFTATLTDGRKLKFPDDYKGKVVLIDFWATWCGPCVAEIPNVVEVYKKYHPKGLEVLGISLDREKWEEKLAEFTNKRGMPWPQVYDGKYWSAEVAKLYGIRGIPHMLLVDGDTGLIVANKTIRGEALAPAVEKALEGRKGK